MQKGKKKSHLFSLAALLLHQSQPASLLVGYLGQADRGPINHLTIQGRGSRSLCSCFLIGFQDSLSPADILSTGCKGIVDNLQLGRMNRPFAVKTQGERYLTGFSQDLSGL